MNDSKKVFNCYTYGEARTGGGQLITFSCRPEDKDGAVEFLKNIRSIDIPITRRVNISHGSYGRHTRYRIKQHKYAGGGGCDCCGYMEVLEIKNPPDGKCGIVLHEYESDKGSVFYEFKELKDALLAFNNHWWFNGAKEQISKCKGSIRCVECGWFSPWFYAVGDQFLQGDFVFPDVIREDEIFRFGRKFVVRDFDGLPTIKTCISVVARSEKGDFGAEYQHRIVYWSDGTQNAYYDSEIPRPLDEKELWIQETMDKFKKLLAGKITEFAIDFIDGSKFVGKWKSGDKKAYSVEGRYKARVAYKTPKGKIRHTEGEFDFKPTSEIPTVEASINAQAKVKGFEVIKIESIIRVDRRGGRSWSGVYNLAKEG